MSDPRTIALDYYEQLVTESLESDRPSLRRLLADLFDEGHHQGVAVGREEKRRDLEARLAEQRLLFDAAARAAELNRIQVDELELEIAELRGCEELKASEALKYVAPLGPGELTYEADPEAAA